MFWDEDVSFEGYHKKKRDWYGAPKHFLGDTPIDAQYALNLIFKTLVDDKRDYPYLTTLPETEEQTNSIMLDLILENYSRKYRRFLKKRRNDKQ